MQSPPHVLRSIPRVAISVDASTYFTVHNVLIVAPEKEVHTRNIHTRFMEATEFGHLVQFLIWGTSHQGCTHVPKNRNGYKTFLSILIQNLCSYVFHYLRNTKYRTIHSVYPI